MTRVIEIYPGSNSKAHRQLGNRQPVNPSNAVRVDRIGEGMRDWGKRVHVNNDVQIKILKKFQNLYWT